MTQLNLKIEYWRNSLADSTWVTPELSTLKEINRSEIFAGRLCPTITATLFAEAKRLDPKTAQESIQVALYPFLVQSMVEHGVERQSPWVALPLIIPALLDKKGELFPCAEEAVIPHILRSCLEPNSKESYVVGTIEDADHYQAQHAEKLASYENVLDYAKGLFLAVTHFPLLDFAPIGVAIAEKAKVALFQPPIVALRVIGLYDALLKMEKKPFLLTNASSNRPVQQPPSLPRQIKFAKDHLGQMNPGYGLSPSQRESLYEFLANSENEGRIDTVNGPPGTGKTTLLQSVVATLWVQSAIRASEPPLIIAASTNNQAVTNIIDSFGAIDLSENLSEELKPLSGRWLPRITSYGVYFPSDFRSEVAIQQGYQIFSGQFKDGGERFFLSHLETETGLASAKDYFLDRARAAFPEKSIKDIQAATALLHTELTKVVGKIQGACHQYHEAWKVIGEKDEPLANSIQDEVKNVLVQIEKEKEKAQALADQAMDLSVIRKSWEAHMLSEPLGIGLFSLLPPIRARRESRDRLYFLNNAFFKKVKNRDDVPNTFSQHETFFEQQTKNTNFSLKLKEKTAQTLNKHYACFQRLCAEYDTEGAWDDLQTTIDTRLRYKAFLLATHYWEGRYLQDVEKKLEDKTDNYDTRNPMKLKRAYYRMAKVAPCFISTFHSLPRMLSGYAHDAVVHLWEVADLLIVDEAGQVPPEIGMSGFALAKRGLLVGDTAQIEPVWSLPSKIDQANAKALGVIESGDSEEQHWDNFVASGQNVSSGNLMRVAQQATSLVKYANIAPGLFLTEHRRCQPEIISYCNDLVYHGHLVPCRPSTPTIYPKMGYAHISGHAETTPSGSRFNHLEAHAIATWLTKEKRRIEKAYGPIEKAVGIVTPFTAQAHVVRKALATLMPKVEITIGTVHSFQGGERPIMLFSPTYGMGHNGRMFFAEDTRMLNVAVSRAKDSFLVFGNMELFHSGAPKPAALLGKFLFRDPVEQEIQGVFSREALVTQPFSKTKTEIVDTLEGHRWLLKDAFDSAREYLMVISPFISHKAIEDDEIVGLAMGARNRGIDVTFVCDLGFNMDLASGKMKPIAQEGLRMLTAAGCKVRITRERFGLHSKLLLSRDLFVSGSFNWLSARRDDSKANHELSQVLRGEIADQEASKQFKGMMARTVEV